jgi:hypothetical protein
MIEQKFTSEQTGLEPSFSFKMDEEYNGKGVVFWEQLSGNQLTH